MGTYKSDSDLIIEGIEGVRRECVQRSDPTGASIMGIRSDGVQYRWQVLDGIDPRNNQMAAVQVGKPFATAITVLTCLLR